MNKAMGGLDAAVTFEFHPGDLTVAAREEARALFFLAGWRRHAAGQMPLRVVCVGEPPDTVLSLAGRCRATVTARTPLVLENGTVFNRALGWEAPGGDGQRLVLAPDVLVLENPAPALAALPPDCFVLSPADKAHLPESAWKIVYRSLDLPLPAERMRPLRVELGLPVKGAAEMPPYYHGAVLFGPQACDLGRTWAAHVVRLAPVLRGLDELPPRLRARLSANGMVALATACQSLRLAGRAGCQRLPLSCDGRSSYLEGAVNPGNVRLFHASGLFGGLADLSQLREHLRVFTASLRSAVAGAVRHRGGGAWRAGLTAGWRLRPLESALRRLYLHEVRPTLRRCGAYG